MYFICILFIHTTINTTTSTVKAQSCLVSWADVSQIGAKFWGFKGHVTIDAFSSLQWFAHRPQRDVLLWNILYISSLTMLAHQRSRSYNLSVVTIIFCRTSIQMLFRSYQKSLEHFRIHLTHNICYPHIVLLVLLSAFRPRNLIVSTLLQETTHRMAEATYPRPGPKPVNTYTLLDT